MFQTASSLLDTHDLSSQDILSLFALADDLDQRGLHQGRLCDSGKSQTLACLLFEPSTRTRLSFQMAAARLGLIAICLESASSSLVKGETLEDTVLNVLAMKPDALVVRYGIDPTLDELLPKLKIPVLSAGSGTRAHPTQALLDSYTILKERGRIQGEKVLIIGDITHSRVAFSNMDVLKKLGAQVGLFGPAEMLPVATPGVQIFKNLSQALSWATVCMGLRIQLERHDATAMKPGSLSDYHSQFGLNAEALKNLDPAAIILHPGPVNQGVEFASEVLQDSRSRVLAQVTNGVLLRAAILARTLDLF